MHNFVLSPLSGRRFFVNRAARRHKKANNHTGGALRGKSAKPIGGADWRVTQMGRPWIQARRPRRVCLIKKRHVRRIGAPGIRVGKLAERILCNYTTFGGLASRECGRLLSICGPFARRRRRCQCVSVIFGAAVTALCFHPK